MLENQFRMESIHKQRQFILADFQIFKFNADSFDVPKSADIAFLVRSTIPLQYMLLMDDLLIT